MSSVRDNVTSAIPWTIVPRIVQMVGSVYTSILIVRSLGQFDYGTLSVIRSILFGVVVVVGFGLGPALNRFIPELRVTDQRHLGRSLFYRALALQAFVWAAALCGLLAFRPLLVRHWPTYADLLILGAGLSLAEVAAGTISQYAVASYRTRQMALAAAVGTLVLAVATVLLLHFGLKVRGVLLAAAAGWTATAVVTGFLLRPRRTAPAAPSASPPLPEDGATKGFPWRRLLAYALPWVPNNILTYVVWRQSETLLLGILRNRIEAGFFDLAYKLPQLVLEFVPGSIYPLVLAGFAETATVAKERMKDVIVTYYWLLFFLVAPLCLLGLSMGDVILARMYGPAMSQAGPYCQAFFLIFTLSFFGTPLSMSVYVIEKVWVNLVLNVAYAVVTLGLDLLLIPRFGLLGATIPTGLVTALSPVVRYAIARRYIPDVSIPWKFIGRCFLGSTPLLLLFWAKRMVHSSAGLLAMLLVAALVTLAAYRLVRVLGPAQRDFIRRSKVPARDWVLRVL